jgi:hypothetical protein
MGYPRKNAIIVAKSAYIKEFFNATPTELSVKIRVQFENVTAQESKTRASVRKKVMKNIIKSGNTTRIRSHTMYGEEYLPSFLIFTVFDFH